MSVLQGMDSAPFLDPARVRLVGQSLQTIRRQLPELADVTTGWDRSWSLIIANADSTRGVFVTRSGASPPPGADSLSWNVRVARIGIRAIDSLNRIFDVASADVRYMLGDSELTLRFRQPMNLPIVARSYARVPEVAYAIPDDGMGDGSWIALIPKGGRMHFVFARGSGDCPSGCVNWDHYYVTFDTLDRSVVLERRALHGNKWSEPVFYWDIPTRYSINPYPDIDSLYAGLRDTRWWYRQHAVHVIGALLGNQTVPWRGAGEQSGAHFTALKNAALARRRESYGALIERLTDADSDVARLALHYLRARSGRTYSGDAVGVTQWQQWLSSSP